jgi:hypothetical protein
MPKTWVIGCCLILGFALTAGTAQAQEIEIHPYAGAFSPGSNMNGDGIYGIRGGVYLMDFVQLDLNLGYINHFNVENMPDIGTRAYLWDVNGSYSLRGYNIPYTDRKWEPFFTVGLGGVSTGSRGSQVVDFDPAPIGDGHTFLAFSYGGGIKAMRLWGPIGLRADVRGRTLPNFTPSSLTWLEITGGFNVMWGER